MPWCDFGEQVKEVRQLKCGDSNLLLCYKHYLEQIEFRKYANKDLDKVTGVEKLSMQTARLWFEVTFDENITDAESLSNAFETLLETAMSTPGILDEYGNPEIGTIWVL